MLTYPIFLSIVVIVRNDSATLGSLLTEAGGIIAPLVSDYELIVIDNASTDDSLTILKQLTADEGLANLQVYALTSEIDDDTAAWVGLENALGDFIVVIDPTADDLQFMPYMIGAAVNGSDVVFASNEARRHQSVSYRAIYFMLNRLYRWFSGIDLDGEAPKYRLLSRRVVSFLLQHPQPAVTYRQLPATAGFTRSNLRYVGQTRPAHRSKRLGDSIDRGMRMLVSTTRAPMRLVTTLSLFGALSNVAYSIYVVIIALTKPDVAPGWISLSMQQSGMFVLISLVLLVLGEYILHMTRLSNEGPLYHIGREFNSARITRREKLNIESASTPSAVTSVPPRRAP